MKKTLILGWMTAIASAGMLGCGGGGSGDSAARVQTGVFVDSPVQGLGYRTTTQAGTTNARGEFGYVAGENVTFSLYGQDLFSPRGFNYLTPFDLSDTSVDPAYSVNLVRFLLAADEDQNASNGIKLPAFSGTFNVNFNQSLVSFEADADGSLAAALASIAQGRSLPSIQAAVAHFNQSLEDIAPDYSINLVGKTATSVMRNLSCSNDVTVGWAYEFGATRLRVVGSDGFTTDSSAPDPWFCTANPEETIDENYSWWFNPGESFDCLPNCTYKELNRVSYVPSDPDGRTAVEWTWHTPGSNTIWYVKTILADPANNNHPNSLNTFVETITID